MEVKRLLFKSSKIDLQYAASSEGVWGEENYFVPMNAIRLWIFHKDGKEGKWMAFSDNYEWIYVSHHDDDFIKFLLKVLPAVERFEVRGDRSCERSLLFLENDMSLNYSFKTDFLLEFESEELPLGEVHHKFWLYNWAHNLSMVGDHTDTYTLNDTEIEKLNDDVNDLFIRGFFHQSKAKYLSTQDIQPNQSVCAFEIKGRRHFFSETHLDQTAPIKDLALYSFTGQGVNLNMLMIPRLEVFIFQEGPELISFLQSKGCPHFEKHVTHVERSNHQSGKSTFRFILENGEFCFVNRSQTNKYIHGEIFERGHYRRLFYLSDENAWPTIDELFAGNASLLWRGKANDVYAPEYVKSFVKLKHSEFEKEYKEGRNGCVIIGLVVAVILGLLIYWIFW